MTDDWWEVQLMLVTAEKWMKTYTTAGVWYPIAFDHPKLWAYIDMYPTAPCRIVGEGKERRWLWSVEHALIVAQTFRKNADPGYTWRIVSEDRDTTIPLEWLLASV